MGYVWQHNKEVLPQGAHNLVHVINGISKDWALAGLRLGFLVSWNTRLLTAYNNPVSVPQTGKLGTYTRACSSVFCFVQQLYYTIVLRCDNVGSTICDMGSRKAWDRMAGSVPKLANYLQFVTRTR